MPNTTKLTISFSLIISALVLAGGGCVSGTTVDQSTPEKAVQTFYDALHNNDDATALAVVPDDVEQTEDFKDTWSEISGWTFNSVTAESYEDSYVSVKFDVTIEGDNETGTDDVEVEQIDGRWWIVEVPR